MPGSKRRALKKLLSPHSQPADADASHSISALSNSANLAPVDSGTSLASQTSVASDSRNYMSDQELEQQLGVEAELNKMEQRKDSIGSGAGGSVPPLVADDGSRSNGLPPAVVDAPGAGGDDEALAVPSLGANGGSPVAQPVFGGGMYGNNSSGANGGANGGGKKKSSKQKFAERQARKQQAMLEAAPPSDPNWDKQLEKERLEEIKVVGDACVVLGRTLFEITPDGHCLYHAVADQLASIGRIPADQANNPKAIRAAAASYMAANPDEFRFFLPSVSGEDTADATTHDGVMTEQEYKQYCYNVEHTGEWGGEPEIQALSRKFQIPIHVIQRGPPTIVSHGGTDDDFGGAMTPEQSAAQGDDVVRISYHRRMYGLGEHYNSLRKVVA